MSITAWNGVAILISKPESCRQRHCNEREMVRRSVARSSRPSDGLALCLLQGRRRTSVTPILHRIIEDLGPRAREVVMSAALVFTDRVCSSLTKDRRRVLIGRRHTTNFPRPGKPSCNSLPKRERNLGRSEIPHEFGKNLPGPQSRRRTESLVSGKTRLHVTKPPNQPQGSPPSRQSLVTWRAYDE